MLVCDGATTVCLVRLTAVPPTARQNIIRGNVPRTFGVVCFRGGERLGNATAFGIDWISGKLSIIIPFPYRGYFSPDGRTQSSRTGREFGGRSFFV